MSLSTPSIEHYCADIIYKNLNMETHYQEIDEVYWSVILFGYAIAK